MAVAIVSTKGWVVIPSELRKKYNLHPGSRVGVVDYGGLLAVVPMMDDPVAAAAGLLKGEGSLTEALLEDRTRERAHEG